MGGVSGRQPLRRPRAPLQVHRPTPAGSYGGAPHVDQAGPRHQPPPPVGVGGFGGYGWRCPKTMTPTENPSSTPCAIKGVAHTIFREKQILIIFIAFS